MVVVISLQCCMSPFFTPLFPISLEPTLLRQEAEPLCCSSLRVDYERIKAVGPDRAAAEWLLRCGAKVRFEGFERWHHDYNALPTGPLGRYKIQGIDATESCIMYRGFDHLGQCYSVDSITSPLFPFPDPHVQ